MSLVKWISMLGAIEDPKFDRITISNTAIINTFDSLVCILNFTYIRYTLIDNWSRKSYTCIDSVCMHNVKIYVPIWRIMYTNFAQICAFTDVGEFRIEAKWKMVSIISYVQFHHRRFTQSRHAYHFPRNWYVIARYKSRSKYKMR